MTDVRTLEFETYGFKDRGVELMLRAGHLSRSYRSAPGRVEQ